MALDHNMAFVGPLAGVGDVLALLAGRALVPAAAEDMLFTAHAWYLRSYGPGLEEVTR